MSAYTCDECGGEHKHESYCSQHPDNEPMDEIQIRIIAIRFRLKWRKRSDLPATPFFAYCQVYDYLVGYKFIKDTIPNGKRIDSMSPEFFENIPEVVHVTFHALCNG